MKIVMYAHGGSENHGCEAIIRSTVKLIGTGNQMNLLSYDISQDKKYGLDRLLKLYRALYPINKTSFSFVKAFFLQKIKHNYFKMDALMHKKGIETIPYMNISLFVGGDNYCYSDVKKYGYINNYMRKKSELNILWGASVEPKVLNDKKVAEDIKKYDMIFARESISYTALKKINSNTYLYPDPAFFLSSKKTILPNGFEDGNTIGINLSPLIFKYESFNNIAYENFKNLINYLIENTDYKVALIPHVVWNNNDDRVVLKKLFNEFKNTDRIIMVEDKEASQLKYIISKCKFFIGARTHATIAAYSSLVPTLVVGYSVKARGIAKDLFGTEKGFVIPVQEMKNDEQLIDSFKWLHNNEVEIISALKRKIKEYKAIENVYAKELWEYEL